MESSYKSMAPEKRYLHDPAFNKLVDTLCSLLLKTNIDSKDLIDATNLAIEQYEYLNWVEERSS